MDRRSFLASGMAGAVTVLGPVPRFSGGRCLAAVPPRPRAEFELEEATIAELQDKMESGEHTAVSLVEAYVARIEALDREGPTLRHVLEINPDALSIARSLDEERRARGPRGPLHGVPILLKDNIDTGDRMTTTAGSLALAGSPAARDAFIVRRLREAGAVLLGKTNLSEWANFRSSHSSSGWSGRGGQGRNPYALDRSPCGSSSGSAAAIAANFAAGAVGTETDGSVVCPASANSVVGIKPTVGLVSRAGIIPIAHSQDTAGPLARTVTDAAILLAAIAGVDADDPATASPPAAAAHGDLRHLDPAALEGARIGVARAEFFGYSEETDRIAEEALGVLEERGAVLVDPADIPHAGHYGDSEFEVLLYEFKADLNGYLARRPGVPVGSLGALIEFNEQNREREMRFFGQDIFLTAEEKGPLTEDRYREALETGRRLSRTEGIDAVMDEHDLDALVAPTTSPPWKIDLVNGDHGLGGFSSPAAVAGYPHVTVPAGYAFGLPVGLSFVGRPYSEPLLLGLAYDFEQASGVRRTPRFAISEEPPPG